MKKKFQFGSEEWFDVNMLDSISALSKEVDKSKLDILNYYPYGKKTSYKCWLYNVDDLRKLYVDPNFRYKDKTESEIVSGIFEEVGRAMYYSIVSMPGFSKSQAIEAFGMYSLFHSGIAGWNKKITKGKSLKQIIELEKKNRILLDLMDGGSSNKQDQILLTKQPYQTEEQHQECVKIHNDHIEHNRKKYGVYIVSRLPLCQFGTNKPLYTKQELAAISFMVDMSFENMC